MLRIADHGNARAFGKGQHIFLIFQQNHAFACAGKRGGMLRRTIDRHGRGTLLDSKRQHAACRTVQQHLVDPAARKRAQNVVSAAAVAGRHFEIQPGFQ